MSINREELINIFSVVSFLAHYERDMHAAEKKVLIAMFKASAVTHEEQEKMKSTTSLDEMLNQIQSDDAKHTLVELMALVAGANGVFEDEERVIIKKIMKRIGITDDHPYFDDDNLDIPTVRANVSKILNSLKTITA
ncbi:MAG: hypothetical protein MAG581_01147 [Deltaproteobacteria bacterium]|jgi:uncharacterized membrane protein YebE (DUF533 family)|nr:hypothetical protein [Deltaproteobacteria bacterium]